MGPRGERLERLRAALLAGPLLVAVLAPAVACDRARQGEGGAPSGSASLAARREAAARRGIEWLLEQRGSMEPDWAYAIFSYLAPIAPDEALAGACRESVDAAARTPFAALPASLDDPALLDPAALRPIVTELLRRQRVGEPWREQAGALEALLRAHVEEVWKDTTPAQQAALLSGLSELGIRPGWTLADSVRLLRRRWRASDRERLLGQAPYVFGLTHVLYAASGYFARYPDAKAFAPEGARLRQALRHYLSEPPPQERYFLDVQGEILVGLKLLRTPEDDDMRAMAERLLGLQNPDGSWGEDFGNHRYHATGVAVQALLDYPDEFRRR